MPRLSLGELIAAPHLGLELLTGGPDAGSREVLGVHPIEIRDPTRWVPRGWVMLTNGLRIHDDPERQRQLVDELCAHGIVALGWSVGTVSQLVPPTIVAAAEERGFPVFGVPLATPFVDIARHVAHVTATDEEPDRRTQNMIEFLAEAVGRDDVEPELLRRLASATGLEAWLYRPDGVVVEASGSAPPAGIWRHLQPPTPGVTRAVEGWQTLGSPVLDGDRTVRWLVLASRQRDVDAPAHRRLLAEATRLLGLVARAHRYEAAQDRGRRAALLDGVLRGEITPAVRNAEARELGFAPDEPLHVAAAVSADAPDRVGPTLERVLADHGLPWLLSVGADGAIAVVQGADEVVAGAADAATAALPDLRVGLVDPTDDLVALPRAAAEARMLLASATTAGVVRLQDADLASWLLATAPAQARAHRLAQALAPLEDHPTLMETLRVYFDCDLKVVEAARRLYLHPNTLRYRLAQIERLLGVSLHAPSAIASLHLALLDTACR